MDVKTLPPRAARGISLVELITTLAVAGITLAVIVPSWHGLAERSQITTTANSLLTDLRYARSTAVTRNLPVSLCPSEDGSSCSGNPFGWHHGYLVFADADGNRKREPGETLLRRHDPFPKTLQLHSTKGRPAVRFRPDGAAWSTNTTFSICHGDNPTFYRAVVLYGSGRARVDRHAPGNQPVTCS